MNSNFIKAALFHKLRFVQRCPYLASEVGYFNADVISVINSRMTEFEIKTSFADFKADFVKEKHKFYREATRQTTQLNQWIPHYFYFVVPEKLVPQVSAYLLSHPGYGLMAVKQVNNEGQLREAPRILVRAKPLHNKPISPTIYQQLLYRMGSELASLAALKLRKEIAVSESDL